MPCIFNIKKEDRHCQYCTATICDERQPKPVETFTTNKIELSESAEAEYNALCNIEHFIDSLQEEQVSDNLSDYINELSKQFPEVSFAKLSRIAVMVAKWQKEQMMKDATEVTVHIDAGGYPYTPEI